MDHKDLYGSTLDVDPQVTVLNRKFHSGNKEKERLVQNSDKT